MLGRRLEKLAVYGTIVLTAYSILSFPMIIFNAYSILSFPMKPGGTWLALRGNTEHFASSERKAGDTQARLDARLLDALARNTDASADCRQTVLNYAEIFHSSHHQ